MRNLHDPVPSGYVWQFIVDRALRPLAAPDLDDQRRGTSAFDEDRRFWHSQMRFVTHQLAALFEMGAALLK